VAAMMLFMGLLGSTAAKEIAELLHLGRNSLHAVFCLDLN
jgi:hypothetical protein